MDGTILWVNFGPSDALRAPGHLPKRNELPASAADSQQQVPVLATSAGASAARVGSAVRCGKSGHFENRATIQCEAEDSG